MHASYMQLSLSNITMSFLDVGSVVFGGVGGIVAFNYVCEALGMHWPGLTTVQSKMESVF